MPITDWPAQERPREKLLSLGAGSLSDAELLAIFINTGIAGKTAVDVARDLIGEYGGLRGILEAEAPRLLRTKGMGKAKYCRLQAALEMARRYLSEPLLRGQTIQSAQDCKAFFNAHLRGHGQEVFACLFLDNRHRLIVFEKMFYGSVNEATIHPREIVKKALILNASAVILGHNHPSGINTPSSADQQVTHQIRDALRLIDVTVLDHLIVGDGDAYSMAEQGLI